MNLDYKFIPAFIIILFVFLTIRANTSVSQNLLVLPNKNAKPKVIQEVNSPIERFPMVLTEKSIFGGNSYEKITKMIVDPKKNVYLAGETSSSNFPIKKAFQKSFRGDKDGFLVKYSSNGEKIFSTYIGGSKADTISQIVVDTNDTIFVVGKTESENFPVLNAFQSTYGGGTGDGFLMKFSNNGDLLFSTFFGGFSLDYITDFHIKKSGQLIICGDTHSTDFPTLNSLQDNYNQGGDGFLARFSNDGELLSSTFFGGSHDDGIVFLALDTNEEIFIIGETTSGNFPVQNAIQNQYGGGFIGDIFISKVTADGQNLIFSTFLGGSNADKISQIILDKNDSIYLSGITNSNDFITFNSYQDANAGGSDGFLTKISVDGQLQFSTFLGGSYSEVITDMKLDSNDSVLLGGITISRNFPLKNPFQEIFGGVTDIFLTKFSPDGMNLSFSTFLGGSENDYLHQMDLDDQNNVYLIGNSESVNYPLKNELDKIFLNENEGFLTKISNGGQEMIFSTLLDISEQDDITLMEIDIERTVYLAGNVQLGNLTFLENVFQRNPYSCENYDSKNCFDSFFMKFMVDLDHDQMPDIWERLVGLDTNLDDSNSDEDGDGVSALDEFKNGIDPKVNDILADSDGDGMPNLWEIQMGLLINVNDAYSDKDGDLVVNFAEYISGTDATQFWNVPFFYPIFPFVISFPLLIVGSTSLIFGILFSIFYIDNQKKRLIRLMGSPDYESALQMKKGKFSDFETFKKAMELNIDNQEEYFFMLELNELMNNQEET